MPILFKNSIFTRKNRRMRGRKQEAKKVLTRGRKADIIAELA